MKLPASLKALINSPAARAGVCPAPRNIASIYEDIGRQAQSKNVHYKAWLALATATTMTMNSPDSLSALYTFSANQLTSHKEPIGAAEFMREVGLKCISFNGIPRVINMLNAFRDSLPSDVASSLNTKSSRVPDADNIESIRQRGEALWASVYKPLDTMLIDKLAKSHPDMPVYIINNHYGALLSDPESRPANVRVGRVLTSIIAIACLRAQTGVGPQVVSHVFGLKKAIDDGTWRDDDAGSQQSIEWLASDEGCTWILESIDKISEAISQSSQNGVKSRL